MWGRRQQRDVCLDLIKMSFQNKSLLLLEISWSHAQDPNLDLWNRKLYILETIFITKASCIEYGINFKTNVVLIALKVLLLKLPSHFCFWCHYKYFLHSHLTEKTQSLFLPRGAQVRCFSSFSSLKSWALWMVCQGAYRSCSW